MSRIDQAINLWEGGKGASGVDTVGAHGSSPLSVYPHEESTDFAFDPVPSPVDPGTHEPPPEPLPPPTSPLTHRRTQHVDPDLDARLVTTALSSVPLEQYRRLAAVLHDEQVHGSLKTVMVTSALPGEGKTLTVANLALTLSGSYGRRVLIVDADLRAPSVHNQLNIRNGRGLSEALRDGWHELPIVEVSPGLSVLTAGRPGQAPLAALTSERMSEVIRDCSQKFDWVLLDTPPVGVLSDAQVLARLSGAVVFVIAAGSTPAAAVERAISQVGAEAVIGTVLNRVEDRRIHEADYYDEYYSRNNEQKQ